jgi:hypothetical protein
MYVLLALAARGLLDMNLRMNNQPAYRLHELHEWLEALDIADEMEAEEKRILYTEEGGLGERDTLNSVWSLEALVVLAWALELAELPAYDRLVETDDLLRALSLCNVPESKDKLARAKLRPVEELDRYNEQIFAYDWRMVDYRVRPQAVDYASVQVMSGGFDLSWAKLIDGDLALQGTPIHQADQDLVGAMNSLAMERHRASNWLCGYATLYSRITTDT